MRVMEWLQWASANLEDCDLARFQASPRQLSMARLRLRDTKELGGVLTLSLTSRWAKSPSDRSQDRCVTGSQVGRYSRPVLPSIIHLRRDAALRTYAERAIIGQQPHADGTAQRSAAQDTALVGVAKGTVDTSEGRSLSRSHYAARLTALLRKQVHGKGRRACAGTGQARPRLEKGRRAGRSPLQGAEDGSKVKVKVDGRRRGQASRRQENSCRRGIDARSLRALRQAF